MRHSTPAAGLGTLCDTLDGKVRELNYKTVRYIGHRDQMKLLVDELRLCEQREQLKEILEQAVPVTFQDVVVTFCTVTGWRKGLLVQKSDARKMYHQQIGDELWSAIQITTAAGICAVLDLHVAGRLPRRGFVRQEDVHARRVPGKPLRPILRVANGDSASAAASWAKRIRTKDSVVQQSIVEAVEK